jgi:hypothetical protein
LIKYFINVWSISLYFAEKAKTEKRRERGGKKIETE